MRSINPHGDKKKKEEKMHGISNNMDRFAKPRFADKDANGVAMQFEVKKVFGDDYSSVSVVLDIINVTRTKIPGSAFNILTTELNVYWAKTAKSSPSPSPTRSPSNAELKRRKLYQLHHLKKSNKTKSNTMI